MRPVAEAYIPGKSPVHSLDPRVRVLATLSLVAVAGLLPDGAWAGFALLGFLGVAVSLAAGLGPLHGARRIPLALPFLAAALPLPFVVPGREVGVVLGLPVSDAGLVRLAAVFLRAAVSVQVAALLVATTSTPDMLWALRRLGLPAALVTMAGMLVRYLGVLRGEAERMMRAREVRCAPQPGRRAPGLVFRARVTGGLVGSLWLRALERSERIHGAMLARGHDGPPPALRRPAWTLRDSLALAGWAAVLGGALALP